MKQSEITITNASGLHARPAANVMKTAKRYQSDIRIIKDGRSGNAKSLVEILNLDISRGDTVTLTCQGEDEEDALDGVKSMMENDFEG